MNDITFVGKHPLIHNVSRHAHESWEFVYCTFGNGVFHFDTMQIPYKEGDVVVIPPMLPHTNSSDSGFRNLHVNMVSPAFSSREPIVVADDSNHFLRNAFEAAFYHYHENRPERTSLLSSYGDLICCYLAAYQTSRKKVSVVEEIANSILLNYADCDYDLSEYLHSLPFSHDYLRKLFHKEYGMTPHQYLTDRRLQIASEILGSSEEMGSSIADVALMCGFREPLYFSKMFKKKYGLAPSFFHASMHTAQRPLDSDSVKIIPEGV